jgi:dienelactone hydrolase
MFTRVTVLFAASALGLAAETPDSEAQLTRWLNRIAQAQLDKREAEIKEIRTLEAAERRKERVRKTILELIGGLPDYSGPLNAKVTGRIDKQKYIIEKVVFESLPRLYVTGNLYKPNKPGRFPGVLIELGHWDQGKVAEQRLAANFALKGFVAFACDPIGQGERIQAYDKRVGGTLGGWSTEEHFQAGAQSLLAGEHFARYMIWDAKRALDYLVSRPEVDAERIGCTGCSGGGTLSTYVSALDPRIKAAAPACWMNSYRALFTGPVGDSEQSIPNFISSGLDETDYVELFAPKPWLIVSTIEDFFPLEGARTIYNEAREWYRLYNAEDHVDWAVGPGPHGTPQPQRERIYQWMIRWLNGGRGDAHEEPVEMEPDYRLLVTVGGQVNSEFTSREIYEIIRERLESRKAKSPSSGRELVDDVRRLMTPSQEMPAVSRVTDESRTGEWISQKLLLETEPGVELHATLLVPRGGGRKPAVLVVETEATPSGVAADAARRGAVVLALAPRGFPRSDDHRPFGGDYAANTRAFLVGRNMAGMRAYDIQRGIDFLAARSDVDADAIRGIARGEPGVWLLLTSAVDPRIGRIWLDRTPHSLRAALDEPLNRNLHMAVLPGFCLKWDLADLIAAMGERKVIWTDPTNWMRVVMPLAGNFRYRYLSEGDARYLDDLLQ